MLFIYGQGSPWPCFPLGALTPVRVELFLTEDFLGFFSLPPPTGPGPVGRKPEPIVPDSELAPLGQVQWKISLDGVK